MGWNIYRFGRKDQHSDAREFEEAARMVEEGLACMRELADEMEDKYSSRMYGMRHDGYGYGEREMWDEPGYHERRRRDSRGRYM